MRSACPILLFTVAGMAASGCDNTILRDLVDALSQEGKPGDQPDGKPAPESRPRPRRPRPISFTLPVGNSIMYAPLAGDRPPPSLDGAIFSTVVRGTEEVPVPKSFLVGGLQEVLVFQVSPLFDCRNDSGECTPVESKKAGAAVAHQGGKGKDESRRLPFPEVRDLPPEGTTILLTGAPEGTEFLFLLPRENPSVVPSSQGSATVLVVDDPVDTLVAIRPRTPPPPPELMLEADEIAPLVEEDSSTTQVDQLFFSGRIPVKEWCPPFNCRPIGEGALDAAPVAASVTQAAAALQATSSGPDPIVLRPHIDAQLASTVSFRPFDPWLGAPPPRVSPRALP
jgi:hypothetical protein